MVSLGREPRFSLAVRCGPARLFERAGPLRVRGYSRADTHPWPVVPVPVVMIAVEKSMVPASVTRPADTGIENMRAGE